jgi:hypothetical protein
MKKANVNATDSQQSQASSETMDTMPRHESISEGRLCSYEELLAFVGEIDDIYRYRLFQKGYRKTVFGEITAEEAEDTREKYSLPDTITDMDFGILEGKRHLLLTLEGFYDNPLDGGHITWLKYLISLNLDKLRCFMLGCAVKKPKLSTSATYGYRQQFNRCLQRADRSKNHFRDEADDWYYTLCELGRLCGFVAAAHWAIGGEWEFNTENFDVPIDWERFYSYLGKRALKLRERNLQELSVIFQINMGMSSPNKSGGEDSNMIRSRRLSTEAVKREIAAAEKARAAWAKLPISSGTCDCGNTKDPRELACNECNADLKNRGSILTAINKYGLGKKSYDFNDELKNDGLGQIGKCTSCGVNYVMGGFPTNLGSIFEPPLDNEPRCCAFCWGKNANRGLPA